MSNCFFLLQTVITSFTLFRVLRKKQKNCGFTKYEFESDQNETNAMWRDNNSDTKTKRLISLKTEMRDRQIQMERLINEKIEG